MLEKIITEVIGVVASLGVMGSMFFNTDTPKGALLLRHINNIGSVFFIWYGIRLGAISTIVLNAVIIVVNAYHIRKIHKAAKTNKS